MSEQSGSDTVSEVGSDLFAAIRLLQDSIDGVLHMRRTFITHLSSASRQAAASNVEPTRLTALDSIPPAGETQETEQPDLPMYVMMAMSWVHGGLMMVHSDPDVLRQLEEKTRLCEQLQNEVSSLRAVIANKNASVQFLEASRTQEDVARMTEEVLLSCSLSFSCVSAE